VNSDSYMIVEESTFVARFLLGDDDTAGSVANVDAFVDLPDESSWALTIVTIDEVRRLLDTWQETGPVGNKIGSLTLRPRQAPFPRSAIPMSSRGWGSLYLEATTNRALERKQL
jgi:hypothetical protein